MPSIFLSGNAWWASPNQAEIHLNASFQCASGCHLLGIDIDCQSQKQAVPDPLNGITLESFREIANFPRHPDP
jgi:hypothetical protein